MTLKHSVVFFSAGVILILGLALIGIIPMGTNSNIGVPESQQNIPIDAQMELILQKIDDELILQDDDNADAAIIAKNIPAKPVDQMNCVELKEFIMSFEKGWGSAVAIYDEKCS